MSDDTTSGGSGKLALRGVRARAAAADTAYHAGVAYEGGQVYGLSKDEVIEALWESVRDVQLLLDVVNGGVGES